MQVTIHTTLGMEREVLDRARSWRNLQPMGGPTIEAHLEEAKAITDRVNSFWRTNSRSASELAIHLGLAAYHLNAASSHLANHWGD